jgi:membrane protease YdiL (CAAX protease family)
VIGGAAPPDPDRDTDTGRDEDPGRDEDRERPTEAPERDEGRERAADLERRLAAELGPPLGPPLDHEAMARTVGNRLRWGAVLALSTTLALGFATDLPLLDVLALPVFLVVFPALALAQTPFLAYIRFERIPAYLSSGLTILIMGGLAMGLAMLGPGIEAAGIAPLPVGTFLVWTVGLTAAAVLGSIAFRPLEAGAWRRSPRGTLDEGMIDALLPRTGEERRLFAGLSLAAGWGEEMTYRGYVPAVIILAGMDPWAAMAVAAGAFGFLHAYQGPVGVVRTALLGMLFGAPVILTGSLLPAMAAHALVDLVLGLVVGPALLDRPEEPPVD